MLSRLLVLALLLAAGCASTPAEPLAASTAPEDFTIDLTIRTGRHFPVQPAVHLRPGHLVLFPDGSLHHNHSGDPGELPEQVRTLDRIQVDELWRLLKDLGFALDQGHEPVNFELLEPPDAGIAYLIAITGGGERRAFLASGSSDDPPDEDAIALVRTLARYAWATDLPEAAVRIRPRRYDFGPDPYQQYRQVNEEEPPAEEAQEEPPVEEAQEEPPVEEAQEEGE